MMPFFVWPFRRRKAAQAPQPWAQAAAASAPASPQRRYLNQTDYLLPKDDDELNRLNFQHYALNLTLGNHYLAPLPPVVRTMVDIGCGTGIVRILACHYFSYWS